MTLEGEHYCQEHQGNTSHYDKSNCTVCKLVAEVEKHRKGPPHIPCAEDCPHMASFMTERSRLEAEVEQLKIDIDVAESMSRHSPAPCGHSSQYCYTEDGGKHIICLLCESKQLRERGDRLAEAAEIFMTKCAENNGIKNTDFGAVWKALAEWRKP